MSRNGSSLADWQDIYNGVNERRKAVMRLVLPADLVPVPQSENHITRTGAAGLVNKIPAGSFCDPSAPLTFQTWDDQYDVGSQPNGVNSLNSGSVLIPEICRYVPQFGSVPVVGSYLSGSGWFLDWIDGALGYMTKAAVPYSYFTITRHHAYYQWDPQTGYVSDMVPGFPDPGVTVSSYVDLWNFAVQNIHVFPVDNWDSLTGLVYTTEMSVQIRFCTLQIQLPCVIPADLTFYYVAMGDNLGFAPTEYAQSGGPRVRGYATVAHQNVTAPVTFGFSSSIIPQISPLPGYTVQEELGNFYAVWDFSNYFQY